MRLILAALALALVPATAAAQDPDPPGVTTRPAQSVGPTTATLTGTVDPNGTATTYRFEYGTTTQYGLQTAEVTTEASDGDVAVQAPVDKLTAGTTYHFRLVAGAVNGADRTFKTTAAPVNPTAPSISRLAAADKTATSARLTARITANRAATTYYVEWGTSARFGNRTPDQTLQPGAGGAVAVSFPLEGLPSHTRIYWRVVATNAAGVTRSGTATFTTLRSVSGLSLSVFPGTVTWSGSVSLSGQVQGAGVNGLTVALEQTSFPYDGAFHQVATARSGRTGVFRFPARPVFLATRYRAVLLKPVLATSAVVTARARARVGIRRARKTRRSLELTGHVNPGLPAGRARLQRRTRAGGWHRIRGKALTTESATRSVYRFKVRRLRRAASYRVAVVTRDGGAHRRGVSRALLVGKRRLR